MLDKKDRIGLGEKRKKGKKEKKGRKRKDTEATGSAGAQIARQDRVTASGPRKNKK